MSYGNVYENRKERRITFFKFWGFYLLSLVLVGSSFYFNRASSNTLSESSIEDHTRLEERSKERLKLIIALDTIARKYAELSQLKESQASGTSNNSAELDSRIAKLSLELGVGADKRNIILEVADILKQADSSDPFNENLYSVYLQLKEMNDYTYKLYGIIDNKNKELKDCLESGSNGGGDEDDEKKCCEDLKKIKTQIVTRVGRIKSSAKTIDDIKLSNNSKESTIDTEINNIRTQVNEMEDALNKI